MAVITHTVGNVARAVAEARRYLDSGAPVGQHLADQLLIPLALAGGGRFRTFEPTLHTRTNAEVIERFLPVAIHVRPDSIMQFETAVKKGFVRKEQLLRALKIQWMEDKGEKPHRLIGMILYDMGIMNIQQINEVHKSLTIPLYEL